MSGKQVRDKAQKIIELWESGVLNKSQIARRLDCTTSNVSQVLKRWEEKTIVPHRTKPTGSRTCQRPDIDNGLKPCGRPLHEIGGEKLGICKHHWDTLKPLGNQKTPINGQRHARKY